MSNAITGLPPFDRPENKPVEKEPGRSLEQSFRKFHAANPGFLDLIICRARYMMSRGEKKVGIALIIEELRHDPTIKTNSKSFKIPNANRAYYARLAMYRAPDLVGFFDLAQQRYQFDPSTVTP